MAEEVISDPVDVFHVFPMDVVDNPMYDPDSAEVERIWLDHWVPLIGWHAGHINMTALKQELYRQHLRNQEFDESVHRAVVTEMGLVMDEVIAERRQTRDVMRRIGA